MIGLHFTKKQHNDLLLSRTFTYRLACTSVLPISMPTYFDLKMYNRVGHNELAALSTVHPTLSATSLCRGRFLYACAVQWAVMVSVPTGFARRHRFASHRAAAIHRST